MSGPSDFLLTLQDPKSAGFRFSAENPVTLMASAYAVLGMEFSGTLASLEPAQRAAMASFFQKHLDPDGRFRDPLFRQEDIQSREHDRDYFEEETSSFCLQALDALGMNAPHVLIPESWTRPETILSYVRSLPWKNPWLDSNRVMFALSRLCLEADRAYKPEFLAGVDQALAWLETQQNIKTGLWHGRDEAPMDNAMAATVHFIFFYEYRKKALKYPERIIDSCLSLQGPHGLFGGRVAGHTCYDYDAVRLLVGASRQTGHRAEHVRRTLDHAGQANLGLQNTDEGFADAKKQLRVFLGKPLPLFLAKEIRGGRYENCWKHLSCGTGQSNAYSTWLRRMISDLTCKNPASGRRYRRLPFLGYGHA